MCVLLLFFFSLVYECVCAGVCTRLARLLAGPAMPVTGAITPSSRPPAAGEAAPGEPGRQLEGHDGKNTLQSWSDDTATRSLSTLCLGASHYASAISPTDGRIRGEHRSLQKQNGCEFPRFVSDGLFLSLLSKSLISAVTFTDPVKWPATRAASQKGTLIFSFLGACFYHEGPGRAGL